MVAVVLVSRPWKGAVPGQFHAVGDLAEGALDAVAPFGDDLEQDGRHGVALLFVRGGPPRATAKARPLKPLSESRSRGAGQNAPPCPSPGWRTPRRCGW